jgi:2-polyprenyl-3-methyl-5-hydroxy-6-metoxy-1,4-benzoquinol methylase
MFAWEDRNQFQDTKAMADEIENIGAEVIRLYNTPSILHDSERGRFWFKHFKVWEYPFAKEWLDALSAKLGKPYLKVMDFGCWLSPFPEYLALQGHEAWGVDNNSWGHVNQSNVQFHYPHVNYFIDDVRNITERGFDAITSCSVLEHIPEPLRFELLRYLKTLLQPEGKMMHIVDFYFPEKPNKDGKRTDFWKVAQQMGYSVRDPSLCPGSPMFDFESIRSGNRVHFLREWNQEARIAIGDDI